MQAELLSDIFPESETTETCETFPRSMMSGLLPEAFPASPQVSQESERARQMTAGSGRRLLPLLKGLGPRGSCLKTLLASCLLTTDWNSNVSVLRWKGKATKYNRLLFQLAVSGHPTEEIGFGLWATPQARDFMPPHSEEYIAKKKAQGHGMRNLNDEVRMWPTPTGDDANKRNADIGRISKPEPHGDGCGRDWWGVEPDVGRLVDGVSDRVGKLRCLGNAIVPQVAHQIIKRMIEAEDAENVFRSQ
jgi:hypothetical protein